MGCGCLKAFLSSTFRDLFEERNAVLEALHKKRTSTEAMEYFLATPTTPLETALDHLRNSDVMILVIGFKAGSLLPNDSGSTYTSAEYDELLKLKKEALVFVKEQKRRWQRFLSWRNEERVPRKKKALNDFKERVTQKFTYDRFTTPDQLALAVILALDEWEGRGRPGARKTFSSTAEYFAGKDPAGRPQLLDFGTTLLGRDDQIRALNDFAKSDAKRVCILSGKGGIGKSKILYDWANAIPDRVIFLKDEPLWHEDSEKEIPVTCTTVIVDDAHRQESFGKILQLLHDTAAHRNLKLIVSTRPGGISGLVQQILRKIDATELLQLRELQELNKKQSEALAEQVLGQEFRNYAPHLAEIGSNSPLVIVAGGRLIATRKINPSTLTTVEEFRSAIFNRLLDEMDLRGPKLVIDPPLPVLHLIAALGPANVEHRDFHKSAEALLGRRIDEILSTIDALASNGIITPRPKAVRILPDVLSDYILEERCIGPGSRSTHYADKVYEHFGTHSLKNLMRNLAELDWRRGQSRQDRLNLLDEIWADIHQRFRVGDEYARHQILSDLSGAAIYQPDHVIALIRVAIDDPVKVDAASEGSQYRAGQDYVLSAVPSLLEAVAYHPDRLRESVTILWELTRTEFSRSNVANSAKAVLKRLASWHRFGNPALNFAMLVEAVRLAGRADAFASEFTPFTLIQRILEREGEFTDWDDERTVSFGGFGLNYAAVGPVRQSALDYLEFALEGDSSLALQAVSLMNGLLHSYLNRVGRESTEDEKSWQNQERERCLGALLQRFKKPGSSLLKAKIYAALRLATGINYPEHIQQEAETALKEITVEDAVAVMDAICTAEHDLPILSGEVTDDWERPISELMLKGRSSLERFIAGTGNQARFTIDQTRACIELRMKTGGFHRFMFAFTDCPDFLAEMADQLIVHPHIEELVSHLSSVFSAIHLADRAAFRERALSALHSGAIHVIHAAANNLRVFESATQKDVGIIQAYGGSPDPVAKRGAIFAITYMGKFTELRQSLKEAVLAIHAEGNGTVAADLADAFGPYGLPLTGLTRGEAGALASEFLFVHDWDVDQGSIPRFLSRFASLFPDEVYELLLRRIELNIQAEKTNERHFRTFRLVHHQSVSFGGIPAEKRLELARDCVARLIKSDSAEEFGELFWDVAGYERPVLNLIIEIAPKADDRGVSNLSTLIGKAGPRLALSNPGFAKDLLGKFMGKHREQLVEAFAYQAQRSPSGVFQGNPEDLMAEREKQFAAQTAAFPAEAGLEDLARALRRFT